MFTYGTAGQRLKPRVEVPKGFAILESSTLHTSAPVASGQNIKSGMIISLWTNPETSRQEFVIGVDASAGGRNQDPTTQCYIAYSDASDYDVVSSGLLPALSCDGKYEIQTGYFKAGETYVHDTYLTWDGVTGNVKPTALKSGAPIVGRITRMSEPIDILPINSNVVPDANGKVLVVQLTTMSLPNSLDAVV